MESLTKVTGSRSALLDLFIPRPKLLRGLRSEPEKDGRGNHAFLRLKEIPPFNDPDVPIPIASSLDVALSRLKEKGVKVMDFWRSRAGWTIKVMVPKA